MNEAPDEMRCTAAEWIEHGDGFLYPYRFVTLSGLNPYPPGRDRCAWFHESVPGDGVGCAIPSRVFRYLKGGPGSVPKCKWYDSRASAMEALACAFGAEWPGITFFLLCPATPQQTGPARVYLDGEFLGVADQVKVAERSTEIHGIGPGHATVNGQRVPGLWRYNTAGLVEFVPDPMPDEVITAPTTRAE